MTDFKAGDIVALITNPWNGKFLVTKISGSKATVKAWEDWGLIGRFFPLRTYTVPIMFLCVPEKDEDPRVVHRRGTLEKPPVSDPVEPSDKPA